jgi:hypothetical protein
MPTPSRLVCGLLLLFSPALRADLVNIGLVSFDVLIPGGPSSPGVNVVDISNLTGDPASGGFALPPDFPAFTLLTFLASKITLNPLGGVPETVALGDIGPGPFTSPGFLQFPDSLLFSSAVFSATLSTTHILLADGSAFDAASSSFSTELLPAVGPSLVANNDLAVMTAANVPEPPMSALLLFALAALVATNAMRRHASSFRFRGNRH